MRAKKTMRSEKQDFVFQGIAGHLKSKLIVPKEGPEGIPELAEQLKMESEEH